MFEATSAGSEPAMPGPGLADALDSARPGDLSDERLIDAIEGWDRMVAWAQVRQCEAIVELAHRRLDRGVTLAGQSPWSEQINEFAIDELACVLHLTRVGAQRRLEAAIDLAGLPATRSAMARGDLDLFRARVLADGVCGLDPRQVAAVEAEVVAAACGQTPGQLRSAVSRAVVAVDPAAADRRHERAVSRRAVVLDPLPDGMACLRLLMSGPLAVACYARLDEAARALGGSDPRRMDQRRLDAAVDVLLGRVLPSPGASSVPPESADSGSAGPSSAMAGSSGQPGTTAVGEPTPARPRPVQLSVTVSSTDPTGPAHLAGYGYLTARAIRPLLDGSPPRVSRVLVDAASGELLAEAEVPRTSARARVAGASTRVAPAGAGEPIPEGPAQPADGPADGDAVGAVAWRVPDAEPGYVPSAPLARFVRRRDITCRFPGCRQPARRCDIDHAVAYPEGGTEPANLMCLCRRHHRLKQAPRWQVRRERDGAVVWRTPAGIEIRVPPLPVDVARAVPVGFSRLRGSPDAEQHAPP